MLYVNRGDTGRKLKIDVCEDNVTVDYCYKMSDISNTYKQVFSSIESEGWQKAIVGEMNRKWHIQTCTLYCIKEGNW